MTTGSGGGFSVNPDQLRGAAGAIRGDADDVTSAGSSAAVDVSEAACGCSIGDLRGELNQLAQELNDHATATAGAVRASADALVSAAGRYEDDDHAARCDLDGSMPAPALVDPFGPLGGTYPGTRP